MHTHVQLRICSQRNHQVCQGCTDRDCQLRAEQFQPESQSHPKSELNPDAEPGSNPKSSPQSDSKSISSWILPKSKSSPKPKPQSRSGRKH